MNRKNSPEIITPFRVLMDKIASSHSREAAYRIRVEKERGALFNQANNYIDSFRDFLEKLDSPRNKKNNGCLSLLQKFNNFYLNNRKPGYAFGGRGEPYEWLRYLVATGTLQSEPQLLEQMQSSKLFCLRPVDNAAEGSNEFHKLARMLSVLIIPWEEYIQASLILVSGEMEYKSYVIKECKDGVFREYFRPHQVRMPDQGIIELKLLKVPKLD